MKPTWFKSTQAISYLTVAFAMAAGNVGYSAGFPKGPQAPLQELENATAQPAAQKASVSIKDRQGASANTAATSSTSTADRKALALGKVDIEVENDLTIITAKLTRQPTTWKELQIEDHGTFLQIKLPLTTIPNSGEFLDGNGPFLKKIATFQIGNDDGALRLFINQDAAKAKLATTAELLGERIIITIDHKKLEQLIQPVTKEKPTLAASTEATTVLPAPAAALAAGKSADQPTTVTESPLEAAGAVSTAKVLSGAESEATTPADDRLDLKGKLVTATLFCAAMLVMLVAAQIWKKKRRMSGKTFKGSTAMEPAPMRILSNLSLSSRQKLALVQVGNQQILLGVSQDNINFLTNVESGANRTKPNQASFGNHLLNADPNAEVKLKSTESLTRPVQRRPADAATTTTPAARPAAPRPKSVGPETAKAPTNSRVNYAVGDDGIADLRAKGIKNDKGESDQPFDDITKLIRDRLRNLPPSP